MKKTVLALLLCVSVVVMGAPGVVQGASVSDNTLYMEAAESEGQQEFDWADEGLKEAMEREFSADFGGSG